MSIFKRSKKIVDVSMYEKNERTIPVCITEADQVTCPSNLINSDGYDIKKWNCKHVYYISDIHLVHKVHKKFKNQVTDKQIKNYIKRIARDLLTAEIRENITSWEGTIILFGGDISSDFEIAEIFYREFMAECKKEISGKRWTELYVYAILGNHELWSFNNINECNSAYEKLFESLNICFLNNSLTWFGKYRTPMKIIRDNDSPVPKSVPLKREEDEEEYDYQMLYLHNILIVGGIGFAGYNQEFNADMGIYRGVLSRTEEIEETCKWEEIYAKALNHAKESNRILIVLTHNPICDWKMDGQGDSNCIYFSGHTHRNYVYRDDEQNIHMFADNQIGYHASNVKFKEAYIYKKTNPFAMYSDGYHEIKSADYLIFYDYMDEKIAGNGLVERQLKNQNTHFYMIKHKGFYGFFLVSPKGTYICAGGRIKKINKNNDIEQFDKGFLNMIQKYLKILSPYRSVQEHISEVIRSFGGVGTIHGCIVDIDFFNHIMLNPEDGTVTYYYSPVFGEIEKHESLLSLLDEHNVLLAEKYRKYIGTRDCDIITQAEFTTEKMVKIDIKNSLYAVSNRMNQLQRLFDKKILRDWNEGLLLKNDIVADRSLTSGSIR